MRLYLKDADGSEITDLTFHTVRKLLGTGGTMFATKRNRSLANLNNQLRNYMERVEVRKNDGSTVIWEGVLSDVTAKYNRILFFGEEILRTLDKIQCDYNGLIAQGVVTGVGANYIDDAKKTWAAAIIGKFAMFSNLSSDRTEEVIWPNSDTDFYHDGSADDPADTETGTYADIAIGGFDDFMEIYDDDNQGLDYYGIEVSWTVPNQATSRRITIELNMQFPMWLAYTTTPKIEIYDFNGSVWKVADDSDITGLGRLGSSEADAAFRSSWYHVIEIDSNIDHFFDGSNKCKIRIYCGQCSAIYRPEKVKLYLAKLINDYSADFSAQNVAYEIDAVSGSRLTFTGQTPESDGIQVGDGYRVGESLDGILDEIWRNAMIHWVNIDFDATTQIECENYKNHPIGTLIRDYAERLDREVWQAIGWDIKCKSSYTSTGINLDETSFQPGISYQVDGSQQVAKVGVQSMNVYYTTPISTLKYFTMSSLGIGWWRFGTVSIGYIASTPLKAHFKNPRYVFAGRLDLDDGTNYSALDIGKTVNIDIDTSTIVVTNGLVIDLSYVQNKGENLLADIMVLS